MTDFDTWLTLEPGEQPTGDDPVLCHLCGRDLSIATIFEHLITEHGFDAESLMNAPIVDGTEGGS